MSTSDCEESADHSFAPEFCVGSLVRLVGLSKTEFNHHVGHVVTPTLENGRVGVSLHNSIFTNDQLPRSYGREYASMSFKHENLRRIVRPEPDIEVSVWGTISKKLILRFFGEFGWGLPDLVARKIADHLCLHTMVPSEVLVRGCSSARGDFPISAVLNANENEWWISSSGSTPAGRGNEYLEFSFGGFKRVSFVALKIPPLPVGPLSVRDFHIVALTPGMQASDSNAWVVASPNPLKTLDRGDLQEFALDPPIEAESLRLVCMLNAAAAEEGGASGMLFADCIGLFQVAFA